MLGSTPVTSSRFTPGANDRSLSFFFTLETFMPAERSGRTSADATSKPATASAWTIAVDIPVGAVLLVGVGEDAVHHALVDAGLAEPAGGQAGVLRAVVTGVVLIEVVEEAGEAP